MASGQSRITEMQAVAGRSFNNSCFKVLRLKETERVPSQRLVPETSERKDGRKTETDGGQDVR